MRSARAAGRQNSFASLGSLGTNSPVSNITVAVRVRPLTEEEEQNGCTTVVSVSGNECAVIEPTALTLRESGMEDVWTRRFYFDYCFSSLDPRSHDYASQETVYDSIGEQVLQSALEGYNVSIFAYGQTGAGKSYTMMGTEQLFTNDMLDSSVDPESLGLVPRICFGLFDAVGATDESLFEVQLSYLEVYNEAVRDLLDPARSTVKVREHPKFGVYVKGLRTVKVHNFGEVSALLSMGNMARVVASTNVNAHSSRSHAIVTMTFRHSSPAEEFPDQDVWTEKISHIHLVDLAGSERVWSTGATGQRLREANNINKSLAVLGDVIQSLAEMSRTGKSRHIPYRNSVLTQLLKESLGGNSRTVMLAAISPCDQQYEETLSTLKYADRAKKVKNKARANLLTGVDALPPQVAAMVHTLQQEIQVLRQQLAEKDELLSRAFEESLSSPSFDRAIVEDDPLSYQLWEREMQLQDLRRMDTSSTGRPSGQPQQQQHQQQQQHPQQSRSEIDSPPRASVSTSTESTLQSVIVAGQQMSRAVPQLVNLNQDPLFSECIVFYIPPGTFIVGSDADADMQLTGSDIESTHCCVEHRNGVVTVRAINNAPVYVNGERVMDGPQLLSQSDRVIFGRHQVYRFDSSQPGSYSQEVFPKVDWEFAIHELAAARRKESFRSSHMAATSTATATTNMTRQPLISPLHTERGPATTAQPSRQRSSSDGAQHQHSPHGGI